MTFDFFIVAAVLTGCLLFFLAHTAFLRIIDYPRVLRMTSVVFVSALVVLTAFCFWTVRQWSPAVSPGMIVIGLALSALLFGLACYFYIVTVFGVFTTSIRVELLLLLSMAGAKGMSEQTLYNTYDRQTVVRWRLKRLSGLGQLKREQSWFVRTRPFSYFDIHGHLMRLYARLYPSVVRDTTGQAPAYRPFTLSETVEQFNHDVSTVGSYRYSLEHVVSARLATKRQTDALVFLIRRYFPKRIHVVDVGCGDGTFTAELMKYLPISRMVGFDPATKAVTFAAKTRPKSFAKRMTYLTTSIKGAHRVLPKQKYDVAVVRGVFHHIDKPREAVSDVTKLNVPVVILEPNGLNPIMKVIERISPYHRAHGERSYLPYLLTNWFEEAGYQLVEDKFCCTVPYFCPENVARALKAVEPIVEAIPIVRKFLCGTFVALYVPKGRYL